MSDDSPSQTTPPADAIGRIGERILSVPRAVLAALLLAGIALNFANVVGRYVFEEVILWAEEAMIYANVWFVFLGAALVAWDGQHLKMDLFTSNLPKAPRRMVNLLSTIIVLACCIFVLINSFPVVELMAKNKQVSVAGGIPMTVPHVAVLVGFGLVFLAIVVRFRKYVSGRFEVAGPAPTDPAPTPPEKN